MAPPGDARLADLPDPDLASSLGNLRDFARLADDLDPDLLTKGVGNLCGDRDLLGLDQDVLAHEGRCGDLEGRLQEPDLDRVLDLGSGLCSETDLVEVGEALGRVLCVLGARGGAASCSFRSLYSAMFRLKRLTMLMLALPGSRELGSTIS